MMSADNWTHCPECIKTGLADAEKDDFENRRLREDYEFYMTDEGILEIDYSASCHTCGWKCGLHQKHDCINLPKDKYGNINP